MPLYLTTMPNGLIYIFIGLIQFLFIKYIFLDKFFMIAGSEWNWFVFIVVFTFCSPFLIGVFYPFYIVLSYKNLLYAYTDKRIIIRTGAWGADYQTTEYDKITDIEVNVGPIGERYQTGNLSFITGTNARGQKIMRKMYALSQPYQVLKEVKKVMLDIKSDLYFPNELRPEINKGYRTAYKP